VTGHTVAHGSSSIAYVLPYLTDSRRQLYYVFDTSNGEQEFFIGPINQFYSEINNLAEHERTDPLCKYKPPSPSSRANIWAQLFQIHPVASTEPEKSPLWSCNYEGGCIICLESFEPGFIIARLHCSHLYHYTCIRTMWDQTGVHTFTCPICRTDSVKWSLHEQVGITPEVVDVWDNQLSIGDQALEYPNITEDNDLYWMWENERLATSAHWNEFRGEEPRDVLVEMAHVRRARRIRNDRLRERVSLRNKIEGLDPTAYGQT
jgi:Ring finger domain